MKKHFLRLLSAFLLLLMLQGCSIELFSTDGLMQAPNSTGDYGEIHKALSDELEKNQNRNFDLKFPLTGNYRSACVLEDVDMDGTSEAIVFYKLQAKASLPSMAYLKKIEGSWKVIDDLGGFGSEIYNLTFSNIDSTNDLEILVSWVIPDTAEKSLTVFKVESNGLILRPLQFVDGSTSNTEVLPTFPDMEYRTTPDDYTTSVVAKSQSVQNSTLTNQVRYTYMKLIDIDNDGIDEIITLNSSANVTVTDESTEVNAKKSNMVIYSYTMFQGSVVLPFVYAGFVDSTVISFDRIHFDDLTSDTNQKEYIYIDYTTSNGSMTEVFYWSNDFGKLIRVFSNGNEAEKKKTLRTTDVATVYSARYSSYVIPQSVVSDTIGDLPIVIWSRISKDTTTANSSEKLEPCGCSVVNYNEKYMMYFPIKWINAVSGDTQCNICVKYSSESGSYIFYYSVNNTEYALLEIYTSMNEKNKFAQSKNCYLITSKKEFSGKTRYYYAKIYELFVYEDILTNGELAKNELNKHVITLKEVKELFYPIDQKS